MDVGEVGGLWIINVVLRLDYILMRWFEFLMVGVNEIKFIAMGATAAVLCCNLNFTYNLNICIVLVVVVVLICTFYSMNRILTFDRQSYPRDEGCRNASVWIMHGYIHQYFFYGYSIVYYMCQMTRDQIRSLSSITINSI